jgi:hypothetical protein
MLAVGYRLLGQHIVPRRLGQLGYWKEDRLLPPKRRGATTNLDGVTTQKNEDLSYTAGEASNLKAKHYSLSG